MKISVLSIIVCCLLLFVGCSNQSTDSIVTTDNSTISSSSNETVTESPPGFIVTNDSPTVQIANPASTFCIKNGGSLKIIETPSGQQGICVFKSGKECEEWAYFRGECGNATATKSGVCTVDSDCVEASCCHSKTCTIATEKPDCKETMCTMNCEPGTLDCGQGSCNCIKGDCVAVIG